MLVTRQCDTGRNTWSSKLTAIYRSSASPRMSNFEPLSTQLDWREQYSSYPLEGENSLLQASFEQSANSNVSDNSLAQEQSRVRTPLEHRHSLELLRQEPQPVPIIERPESAPPGDCGNQTGNATRDDSLVSTESTALSLGSLGSNPLSSASSGPAQQGTIASNEGETSNVELKEEEDEDDDDDDMLDIEEGGAPQTAAERRAERRKMKRFRYDRLFCPSSSSLCLN